MREARKIINWEEGKTLQKASAGLNLLRKDVDDALDSKPSQISMLTLLPRPSIGTLSLLAAMLCMSILFG